jgi:hypothetical protein
MQVHHINADGLDNRRCNLRVVTRQQNLQSRRMPKNNTSGYKGVQRYKDKWRVQFFVVLETAEDAARAYDKLATLMFGEHAVLNFPE